MDNNIDFKDLWVKQTISPFNTNDLFSKVNRLKRTSLRKLIIANVLLIVTCVFIMFIWYYYQPKLITTKIGIVVCILAMVIYLFAYNQFFPLLKTIDYKQSNIEYLQDLISIKTKQHFLQSTMLRLYFIMLSSGLCLYMYEYTLMMPTFWAILSYTITLAWIGFNWFYIRPKIIKRQQIKIDDLISKFENVKRQLQDE